MTIFSNENTVYICKWHGVGGVRLVEDLEKQRNLGRCKRTSEKLGVYQKAK